MPLRRIPFHAFEIAIGVTIGVLGSLSFDAISSWREERLQDRIIASARDSLRSSCGEIEFFTESEYRQREMRLHWYKPLPSKTLDVLLEALLRKTNPSPEQTILTTIIPSAYIYDLSFSAYTSGGTGQISEDAGRKFEDSLIDICIWSGADINFRTLYCNTPNEEECFGRRATAAALASWPISVASFAVSGDEIESARSSIGS